MFFMEPRILLFPDLLFVHCVTFREKKHSGVCQLCKTLCFLVAIKLCLVIQFVDCWMYESRKQVLTCSAQTHQ